MSSKISPQMFRTKIVHTSGIFFDFGGVVFFDFGGSRNIFNLCSHMELNTQNPNPIFKITICFTKTLNTPKCFRTFGFFSRNFSKNIFFCIMYKLYNSIVVFLGEFCNFGILDFWDFYIYIYYTCRSLTRVGLLHV